MAAVEYYMSRRQHSIRSRLYKIVDYMEIEGIDPAIRFDKLYLRIFLKICMIPSLRVSGSIEIVQFQQSKKS